jgi:hypothetical protein
LCWNIWIYDDLNDLNQGVSDASWANTNWYYQLLH